MLPAKQKRQLRSEGNHIKASVMVGREGVTFALKRFIDEAFNNKTLIKIRVLDTCEQDRKEVAAILSKLKDTELVQLLGRTILLYRPLKEDKKKQEKKIKPPGK